MSISTTNLGSVYGLNNAETDGLFKTKYEPLYEDVMNTSQPTLNLIPKRNDFTGKEAKFPVPLGYMTGVGAGKLPQFRTNPYGEVNFTAKKVYAINRIDRESIMASLNDSGAFVRLMAEAIKRTAQGDAWNHNRILFNDGTGTVGTIGAAPTLVSAGIWDIVISTATWKEANWEEGMLINIESGNTDLFLVTSVTPATRTIRVQRQAGGSKVPANTDVCYMQGSENADPMGLKILDTTVGSAYGIPVDRKWSATRIDASAAAISEALLNRLMVTVEKKCGKTPNMAVTSYKQYELLLNTFTNQKRYNFDRGASKGKVSMAGIEFIGSQGVMNIFPDKFCEDGRFYALNTKFMSFYRRPNTGFVKEDIGGQGYLRVVDEDQFELRHATYEEFFIALPFHGVLYNLAVA
jgi:hypothetical protein